MIAVWTEADLLVADQFRDGSVPANQEPLTCCRMAFEAPPEGVSERRFRGDSACYEGGLLQWLSSEDREKQPGGRTVTITRWSRTWIGMGVGLRRARSLAFRRQLDDRTLRHPMSGCRRDLTGSEPPWARSWDAEIRIDYEILWVYSSVRESQ
jgi:hypothetical protein